MFCNISFLNLQIGDSNVSPYRAVCITSSDGKQAQHVSYYMLLFSSLLLFALQRPLCSKFHRYNLRIYDNFGKLLNTLENSPFCWDWTTLWSCLFSVTCLWELHRHCSAGERHRWFSRSILLQYFREWLFILFIYTFLPKNLSWKTLNAFVGIFYKKFWHSWAVVTAGVKNSCDSKETCFWPLLGDWCRGWGTVKGGEPWTTEYNAKE